jgi:hypothetical protein
MGRADGKRVVLELDPGDPISGQIAGPGEDAESFRGWVELVSKLERFRGGREPEQAEPDQGAEGPGGWALFRKLAGAAGPALS